MYHTLTRMAHFDGEIKSNNPVVLLDVLKGLAFYPKQSPINLAMFTEQLGRPPMLVASKGYFENLGLTLKPGEQPIFAVKVERSEDGQRNYKALSGYDLLQFNTTPLRRPKLEDVLRKIIQFNRLKIVNDTSQDVFMTQDLRTFTFNPNLTNDYVRDSAHVLIPLLVPNGPSKDKAIVASEMLIYRCTGDYSVLKHMVESNQVQSQDIIPVTAAYRSIMDSVNKWYPLSIESQIAVDVNTPQKESNIDY